eukprot:scaffold265340_cov30-Tisochrysis_lutea.AAC.2
MERSPRPTRPSGAARFRLVEQVGGVCTHLHRGRLVVAWYLNTDMVDGHERGRSVVHNAGALVAEASA